MYLRYELPTRFTFLKLCPPTGSLSDHLIGMMDHPIGREGGVLIGLGVEKLIAAEKDNQKIAVEVKTFSTPLQRNDLVVFKAPPEIQAQNLRDDLIKRVIGLPGDVVQIHDGQTFINGRVVAEPLSLIINACSFLGV